MAKLAQNRLKRADNQIDGLFPLDDPEQSKRLIDMAREVEADRSKEDFEKAFKKVAKRETESGP